MKLQKELKNGGDINGEKVREPGDARDPIHYKIRIISINKISYIYIYYA